MILGRFVIGRLGMYPNSRLPVCHCVKPSWRSLYKGPLTKNVADLQWRELYGIVAVNSFLSIMALGHTDRCVFCGERETVFHCYSECVFSAVQNNSTLYSFFILGFKYREAVERTCKLLNSILGQAKMAAERWKTGRHGGYRYSAVVQQDGEGQGPNRC